MIATAKEESADRPQPNALDRWARRAVFRHLTALTRGQIILREPDAASAHGQRGDLQVVVRIHHPRFYRHAILGGTLSVAESYVRGDWDCDDLTGLFRIFVRNRDSAGRFDAGLARLAGWGHQLYHHWHRNTHRGSRHNIAAHYDLGNEFYRLWLDDSWAYSCGIFPSPHATLEAASSEKFDRVCRQLNLHSSNQLLEIGTGWGGFALHAARHYGCHVTSTTISRQQFELAQQRAAAEGLADQITLLNVDYRDLTGTFDKLASIEMIEAVGHRYLDHYFKQCGRLLKSDGSLVLQAIVMPERRYKQYLRSVDFIQRYIFPGGCLPSLAAMLDAVGRTSDLRLVYAEDFASHYAETLRRWRHSFETRIDEVRQLGYSDKFIRLWRYYLAYCEAAFEERAIGLLQVRFDKPDCRHAPWISTKHATDVLPTPSPGGEQAGIAATAGKTDHESVGSWY